MRGIKLFAIAGLAFGLLLPSFSPLVQAATAKAVDLPSRTTPIDISTSPLPISLSAAPGTTATTDIRIKNNSETQKIKVGLMKFSAYGEEGKPALQDREAGDDYFEWVSFSPSEFVAEKNQWKTIKMSIDIPKDAGFSYYYAVTFTPANAKPTGKGNLLLGSTAVLVLLDVQNPNAKRSMQVVSFQADKRFYEFLPATFSVKMRNNGNVHLKPHGNIFIKRGNKQVASLILNSQQGSVLPGTNRIYTVEWNDGFPVYAAKEQGGKVLTDKQGKPIQELKWDWSKFSKLKMGRYTAQMTAIYDNGKQDVPVEATVSFWVMPWRIIFGVLVVGGLALLGLWSSFIKPFVRRIRKGKVKHKNGK